MQKPNKQRDIKNIALFVVLLSMAILFFSVTLIKFSL